MGTPSVLGWGRGRMRPRVCGERGGGAGPKKLSHGSQGGEARWAGWGMAGEVTQGQRRTGPRKAEVGGARGMGDPEPTGRARDSARVPAPPERRGRTVKESPDDRSYGAGV